MSYVGIRSFNLGDMNGSQKSKNILKVYAELYVNVLMLCCFSGERFHSFHKILRGLYNPKKVTKQNKNPCPTITRQFSSCYL